MSAEMDILAEYGAAEAHWVRDPPSGLEAVIVLHNMQLGPAAGGIRTRRYATRELALRDACELAQAMTFKCAMGGLSAGGGKAVVIEHQGLHREAAFAALGRAVQGLGGRFRTAGDLGTTAEDLKFMAEHTEFVHIDESGLAEAVARGLRGCIDACLKVHGAESLGGVRVAVQGCGSIGAAVARELAAHGAALVVTDVDPSRASAIAAETGAQHIEARDFMAADVDILAPCALGGVVRANTLGSIRAWAVCGAANNILASPGLSEHLMERGVLHVPDFIASAGAVVRGIARSVMGVWDPTSLVDTLGETAEIVLRESLAGGQSPHQVALMRAKEILANADGGDAKSC